MTSATLRTRRPAASSPVRALPPIVRVDPSRCVNCHACIAACPVKYCNRAVDRVVEIEADRCIGCGCCIDACTHQARVPVDDWPAAWRDLHAGIPMVAIVAPAVAAAFPGQHLNLNGWLRRSGVAAVFDVSLGAELTVRSYVRHLETQAPSTVIAQPCPAIVNYIELYRPELLPYLAPAGSPMHHVMALVRAVYRQYAGHKLLVISPCLAKRREFEEIGLGDYNATMVSIRNHLDDHRVELAHYPVEDYDGLPAERAVMFSTPGGLRETVERWNPDVARATRKIEGPRSVYPYLDELPAAIRDNIAPLLVDCLNCEKGCNGGTGTPGRRLSLDRLERIIDDRQREARLRFGDETADDASLQAAVVSALDELTEADTPRTYVDRSRSTALRRPGRVELKAIYTAMNKLTEADILNCGACGYGNCEAMAIAIHNGLNEVRNCVFYLGTVNREQERRARQVEEVIGSFEGAIAKITGAAEATGELHRVSGSIVKLAHETHIVALNATIEAARSGSAGATFAVVSAAVRDLAKGIRREAEAIEPCSEALKLAFRTVLSEVNDLGQRVVEVLKQGHEAGQGAEEGSPP